MPTCSESNSIKEDEKSTGKWSRQSHQWAVCSGFSSNRPLILTLNLDAREQRLFPNRYQIFRAW